MASKRGNPVARVGNYVQDVDSVGVDQPMKDLMFGTPMTQVEKNYVKGTKRPSAMAAVRKARKANKQPPVQEDE